ncbi:hypothetical protein BGX34_010271, partial [Mortierella sp. NVP85]
AKALKFFLGLHCYIADPVGRAGDLTKARDAILGSIKKRHTVQRSIGAELLTSGLVAAFGDFTSHYALPGITKIGMFKETYEKKKADMNICLSYDAAELEEVEKAIGYDFTNKGLLALALTAPVKGDSGPDYDRLEYLGDAVLDVLAMLAWIDNGSVARSTIRADMTVCNMALHAVSIGAGLEKHIKKCGPKVKAEIETIKALYLEAKTTLPLNKPYWNQGPLCKTLGDVVESVLGAVFLDSGLRLPVAEGVFKRIHWPIVEKRLA